MCVWKIEKKKIFFPKAWITPVSYSLEQSYLIAIFQNTDFSLQTELHHYEKRLLKLRNLHLEHAVSKDNRDPKLAGEKVMPDLEHEIKKQSKKVEKLHADISSKILRNELW